MAGLRVCTEYFSILSPLMKSLRLRVRGGDIEHYLCGSLLPSHARESFFVCRALNLELAGVRDAVRGNANMGRVRMAFWRDMIAAAYASKGDGVGERRELTSHPLFAPLAATVHQHKHTRRWFDRLVDARERDLDGAAPATLGDVEGYGEATQSSLLYLCLEALGVRDVHADHAASHIGKAMGIATLLRALPVHARLGQQYLPTELLAKHGLSAADVEIQPHEVLTSDGKPLIPQGEKDGGEEGSKREAAGAAAAASPQAPTPPIKLPPSTLRFAESPAALRQRKHLEQLGQEGGEGHHGHSHGPNGECQSGGRDAAKLGGGANPAFSPSPHLGGAGQGAGLGAAKAALGSGIGASSLVLNKEPRVRAALAGVVFDMACQARAHLDHAREMSPKVPQAARAALLPAVPLEAFLSRLEHQQFDVFAAGGLGPWVDGRPYARLLLQTKLLWHTMKNTY